MDRGQLHRLGRRLIELSRRAAARDGGTVLPPVETAVVEDVLRHPGTSVTAIARRTGFVQSHVSASVARLRERGVIETGPDAQDRRRTTVRVSRPAVRAIVRRARRPVDDLIGEAVADPDTARRVVALLDELAALLVDRDADPVDRGADPVDRKAGPVGRQADPVDRKTDRRHVTDAPS